MPPMPSTIFQGRCATVSSRGPTSLRIGRARVEDRLAHRTEEQQQAQRHHDDGADDDRCSRGLEADVGVLAGEHRGDGEQADVHEEREHLRDADARGGQRRVQPGLLQVAHVDGDRADRGRRHEGGEPGRELRGERADVRELLRHEARQRQRGAHEREHRERQRGERPAPVGLAQRADEVLVGQLREQHVRRDRTGDDGEQSPRLHPAQLELLGVAGRGSQRDQLVAQLREDVLLLAHPTARVGGERDQLQRRQRAHDAVGAEDARARSPLRAGRR